MTVSCKLTSSMSNRQKGKQFMSIRSNLGESTTFLTHPGLSTGAIFSKSRANWLPQFWHGESTTGETIRVDSIKSTPIDNIFNPPSKPRSATFSKSHANRLLVCQIHIRGNDLCQFNRKGFKNRFPVSRMANTKDESTLTWFWVQLWHENW